MSDTDPAEYIGRGEKHGGFSVNASDVGNPSLRVYLGPYHHTFDSVDEARAALDAFEQQIDEYEAIVDAED